MPRSSAWAFTRALIDPRTTLEYNGKPCSYHQLLERIDRFHAMFDHYGISHGDKIAVHSPTSVDFYAIALCAFERGVTFCVLPQRTLFHKVVGEDHGLVALGTQYIFQETDNPHLLAWGLPVIDMAEADRFDPVAPTIVASGNDIALTTLTSGTTGTPKRLFHTHTSITVAATVAAKHCYQPGDRVLIYSTINHLGVVTVQVLPVLLVGCHIVLHEHYLDGEYFLTAMRDTRLNKAIVFFPVIRPGLLDDNPRWQTLDLSHFDNIITGGSVLYSYFVDTLLGKGVKSVSSIYGLSEALPPVFITTIDPAIRQTMENHDFGMLGRCVGYWQYRIKDDRLWLRGPSVAQGGVIIDDDGFLDTGDKVIPVGDQLQFGGRFRTVQRQDVLVDLYTIEKFVCWQMDLLDVAVMQIGDKLIAAAKFDDQPDFDAINDKLEAKYGPAYRIDEWLDGNRYHQKEDAIKMILRLRS